MKLFYFFILLSMMNLCDASSKKTQVRKTLSSSKKIPVKSIKSPDGDIIDCINIYHQPAFDHPLLKNHTILMRPSLQPRKGPIGGGELFQSNAHGQEDKKPIAQLWQLGGRCPEGTIPIRRNQKARYAKKEHRNFPLLAGFSNHEHAFAYVQSNKYLGAKATINLWQPQVQGSGEFSLAQIWVLAGANSALNSVEAGWMVFPSHFGDSNTRLFNYWTRDRYQSTGCYNLDCPGFVHTSNSIALGATISPVSTYHGAQHEIILHIFKDPKKNVWWLQYGNDDVIGYWPASLFKDLADSASLIEWGGEIINNAQGGQHTTTQMGSGHFAEEQAGGASYFKNLQVVDQSNTLVPPGDITTVAEKPNCYTIVSGKSDDAGDYFYFGGPGRNPKCP
ncbi:protein neprosin-like [Coffea arabica]|uniref:Protein neprosin-like n=1 Tax=Coffea arabica TaxID=13443 RepID=A0ABM4UC39_COFAR